MAGSGDVAVSFQGADGLRDGLPGHSEPISEGGRVQCPGDQGHQRHRVGRAKPVKPCVSECSAQPRCAAGGDQL